MTSQEQVRVTQADERAAEAYWDSACDDWNPWCDISEEERVLTVQAFARHRQAAKAEAKAREAELKSALVDVSASLAAAISLLERGGKAAKKAAPSDRMFDQMVADYTASLERARALLTRTGAA